jgi:hypothetical protein
MTTNPTPTRGKVWRVRFDPAEGDEIKKVRTAVVVSEDAVGRLRLKIVGSKDRGHLRISIYDVLLPPSLLFLFIGNNLGTFTSWRFAAAQPSRSACSSRRPPDFPTSR